MADIQDLRNLFKKPLSGASVSDSGDFASKVYRDEPILIMASQLKSYTPPKYLEMREIAQSCGVMDEPEAQIFYRQGKFMEDFEDDFDYRGTFVKYFPTYQAMNAHQLRGYFSWRTKVRRGVIERTQLSFAFVYIYELLNRIGVNSAEEGYHKLKIFRDAYGELDSKINGYVNLWLKDYVVYNNLDKSLLENIYGSDIDSGIQILLDYETHGPDAVFSALNSMSSYNLENSRFFKQYPDDVKKVTRGVFAALSDHYDKHGKGPLCERFFGRFYAGSYVMFKSAVFFHRADRADSVYEIGGHCKYICENGNWTCERFFRYGRKNQRVGTLLKNIDFFMRRKYGFKSALKAENMTRTLQDVIIGAIDRRLEEKRKAALPDVAIDVSKLQDIRDAAMETQNKLIVEEFEETYEEAGEPDTSGEKPLHENGAGLNKTGLNDIERRFINRLLNGEAYGDLIQPNGLMLSTLVDSINERLFDMFGDTVIVDGEGGPALIEDYADELKGITEE